MTEFVKSPIYDWTVTAEYESGSTAEVLIGGQITIEDAIQEARYSLSASELFGELTPYAIIGAERIKK